MCIEQSISVELDMCIFGLVRVRQQGWKVNVSVGQVVDKDYVSYVRSCCINLSLKNREKIK
jgi:hypothetical protein